MDIQKIKDANTKYIGKEIEYYKEIDSTHLYAKKIANQGNQNGKIIIAERQTGGIGTKGRSWHTGNNKNIAMTIILKPKCKVDKFKNLTIDISKAMKNAIKELYDIDLEIKEPNDLMLNQKKICGVLTEISTTGEKINYLLISLGFNVNEDNFSEEIKQIATSLKAEYNKTFKREDIIKCFIEELAKGRFSWHIIEENKRENI